MKTIAAAVTLTLIAASAAQADAEITIKGDERCITSDGYRTTATARFALVPPCKNTTIAFASMRPRSGPAK